MTDEHGNPFVIPGPAVISFSGGRTSGYMLRRALDAGIATDVHVLFANTGKEREETLAFVHDIETRWDCPITWLEREAKTETSKPTHRVVTFDTASRDGGPFAALIRERKYLPNPVTRFCTTDLKIRTIKSFMRTHGYEHWINVVGLRADEPSRVTRMRAADKVSKERWSIALPLADAGVTLAHVDAFWRAQPFDLRLRPWEGNCDLCFLKGHRKRERIIRDRPDLATWWIEREREREHTFRAHSPTYETLAELAQRPMLFDDDTAPDDLADCACTD